MVDGDDDDFAVCYQFVAVVLADDEFKCDARIADFGDARKNLDAVFGKCARVVIAFRVSVNDEHTLFCQILIRATNGAHVLRERLVKIRVIVAEKNMTLRIGIGKSNAQGVVKMELGCVGHGAHYKRI